MLGQFFDVLSIKMLEKAAFSVVGKKNPSVWTATTDRKICVLKSINFRVNTVSERYLSVIITETDLNDITSN